MVYPHCNVCAKIFRTRRLLDKHTRAYHNRVIEPSNTRLCNICGRAYPNQTKYNKHLKSHKNYLRCNICSYVTTVTYQLKQHVEQHQEERTFCGQCNVFYDTGTTHEHTSFVEATMVTPAAEDQTIPLSSILEYEGGGLELEIPLSTLEKCSQLTSGQSLQLSGQSHSQANNHVGVMEREISLFAVKKDDSSSVCLVMQTRKMGGILLPKSMKWSCELTSCKSLMTTQEILVPDTGSCHQVLTLSVLAGRIHAQNMARMRKVTAKNASRTAGSVSMETQNKTNNESVIGNSNHGDDADNCDGGDTNMSNVLEAIDNNHSDISDHDDEEQSEDVLNLPTMLEDDDSDDNDATWTLRSTRARKKLLNSKPTKRPIKRPIKRPLKQGAGRPGRPRKTPRTEEDPEIIANDNKTAKAGGIEQRKQRRERRLNLLKQVKTELDSQPSGEQADDGNDHIEDINMEHIADQETNGAGNVVASVESLKPEDPLLLDVVSEEMKDYITIVSADKQMKEEVLRLNSVLVSEMVAAKAEGTAELQEADLSQQMVCIVCMRKMRKNFWFFFCCHLEESHVMTPRDYRSLLLMDNAEERGHMIQKYREKQVMLKQRYKQIKYKVSKDEMIQCPGCPAVLTAFGAFCAHIRTVHIHDANYGNLVEWLEDYRDQRRAAGQRQGKLPPVKITCDYCGIEKLGLNGIKVHIRLAHPEVPDLAAKMKQYREFVRSETLRHRRQQYHSEEKKSKEVFCRFCGEKFAFRSSRGRHEKYSCEKNPNRVKTFTCQYCDNRFFTKEELDVHRQQHKDEDFKFVCDICGLIRRTKAGMYEHKKSKHGTKPPKHKCPYCDKSFFNKDRLQSHVTVHSDHRAFQCEICGSNFKTRASVTKHQNAVHFNKYTYYCDKCGHGMAKLSYLKAHRCGRIRRNQHDLNPDIEDSQLKPSTTVTHMSAEAIVSLPELTLLPKMETKDLVYSGDHEDKEEVILETEIAAHILMGSTMEAVEGTNDQPVTSLGYALDPNNQPMIEVIPRHIDMLPRPMDMIPRTMDSMGRTIEMAPHPIEVVSRTMADMASRPMDNIMIPRTTEYIHQDLSSIPQVALIDYTQATPQVLGTQPIELYRSYQTYQATGQPPGS